jgi:hypothetical protein
MTMTPKGFVYVAESPVLAVKPGGKVRLPFTIETASGPKARGHEYTLLGYSVPRGYAIVDIGDDERLIDPELLEAC